MHPKKLSPEKHSLSLDLLTADAVLMVSAGMSTTAYTSQVGCWHLIQQPAIAERLLEELVQAFPEPLFSWDPPPLEQLEKLPFLVRQQLIQTSKSNVLKISIESSHQRVIATLIRRTWSHDTCCACWRYDCSWNICAGWGKLEFFSFT